MTLDWRPQRAIAEKLRENECLRGSCDTDRSGIWCAAASSAVAYALGVTPYAHRHQDDGRGNHHRHQTRIRPTNQCGTALHEDTDKWGMGMPSLAVEYATRNTTL
jgi:hypothetical protein